MSYDTTAPFPSWPMQPAPPAPPAGRRRPPAWLIVAAGLVVVALIIGLVIWAPWNPSPVAPAAVQVQSPTATTAVVSWSKPKGGATPDRFLILRDGKQVGIAPAADTSWTDTGLAPGSKHQYAVETASGGAQSSPSTVEPVVTTLTPAPVGLAVTGKTWTTLRFRWVPSPKGPAPDHYTIFTGTDPVDTVPGSVTSYDVARLQPGQGYQYSVAARWGSAVSDPSAVLTATTTAAPLTGSVPVHINTTAVPGGGASLSVGDKWDDTWRFTPTCTTSACTMSASAEFAPKGFAPKPFTVKLTGSGGSYQGTATAQITHCGSANVKNTITLHLTANKGAVSNGGWTAWAGKWVLSAPYIQPDSTHYCPSQSWTFTVTGTHS
jgi:hypothetical protein